MGLDMYLYAESYISAWGHSISSDDETRAYHAVLEATGMADLAIEAAPSGYVRVCCAYWRKANQVHQWFVQYVQGGEDECKPHPVSREQLVALRDLCRESLLVLASNEDLDIADRFAAANLPTASGFFFGSTDYDGWYWRDVEDTVKQLDAVLSKTEGKSVSFIYRSSW